MAIKAIIATQFDPTGLNKATKQFGQLGKSIGRTFGALGVGFGFAKLASELKQASRAAVEDIKSQGLLASQLRNTVGANDQAIAATEKYINKLQLQTSIADDTLRPALAGLVRATGDVSKAQALLALSTDIAAGTGKDLGSVSTAVGKAAAGQTSALFRLIPSLKGSSDWANAARVQFAGMAEEAANLDPFQRMQVIFGEIQEQVGIALVPTLQSFANWLASPEGQGKIAIFVEQAKNLVASMIEIAKFLQENINWLGPFAVAVGVATVAIKLFNLALNASPFGRVLAGISLLIGVMALMNEEGKKTKKMLDDVGLAGKQATGRIFAASNAMKQLRKESGLPSAFNTDSQSAIAKAVSGFAKTAKKTKDIWGSMGMTPPSGGGNKASKKDNFAAKKLEAEKKAAEEAAKAAAELAARIKELKTEFRKAIQGSFKDLLAKEIPAMGKFEQKVYDTFTGIKDTILNADKLIMSNKKKATFLGLAEFAQQQLSAIAKQRDQLAVKIENAKSFMDSVKDSIFGSVNITDMGRSAKAIIMNFQKVIKSSLDFNKNIKALQAAGLGQDAIKQIIEAGAQVGGQTAQALLRGGPEAIAEVNSLFGQLTDVAGTVSETAGQVMFGSGVDLSNGLIAGLLSQEEQLKIAADTLATAFQNQFNKRLGLGKPDTGFINVGGTTKGGTVVNLTVNAPMGTGSNIGKLIVDEISRFEKQSGVVFARA